MTGCGEGFTEPDCGESDECGESDGGPLPECEDCVTRLIALGDEPREPRVPGDPGERGLAIDEVRDELRELEERRRES